MIRLMTFVGLITLLLFTSCEYKEVEIKNIRNFRVVKVEEQRVFFAFDIQLINPNSYSLKVSSSDLDCSLNGSNFGKLNLGNTLRIPAGNTDYLPVESSVELGGSGQNLPAIVMATVLSNSIEFGLSGEIRGGAFLFTKTIPINHTERVYLDGFGME